MPDDDLDRRVAEATDALTAATDRITRFTRGVARPDPASLAEYAALVRETRAAWDEYLEAFDAWGLSVPSLEPDEEG